ncbi:10 kDa chaperonin, cyanelle [Platanthera guangdongensis]|uniref:10 kDa chaperonin, cyanelle n=1 Tax=Platanthera guangdongensis TaxID=2320717 RepID=A0ABR2LTH1_9ASPA
MKFLYGTIQKTYADSLGSIKPATALCGESISRFLITVRVSSMASLLTTANPFILSHQSQVPSSLAARSPLTNSKHLIRLSSLRVSAVAQKWEPSKVVLPQVDRVLIRLEELPEKSAGGVLLPKSAVKFERYLMGEILSVGGDVGAGELEAGKKVLFSDINAYDVSLFSYLFFFMLLMLHLCSSLIVRSFFDVLFIHIGGCFRTLMSAFDRYQL